MELEVKTPQVYVNLLDEQNKEWVIVDLLKAGISISFKSDGLKIKVNCHNYKMLHPKDTLFPNTLTIQSSEDAFDCSIFLQYLNVGNSKVKL